jgi:hypothetical protein
MGRRREQRVREQLLKRELLLRLRAEHMDAPGKSGDPTEYFLRDKRCLLRRHPYFALRYQLRKRRWRVRRPRPRVGAVGFLPISVRPDTNPPREHSPIRNRADSLG